MRNLRMDVSVGVIALVCLVGCSGGPSDLPDLGKVTGTVKIDGNPVANVMVSFTPKQGGRPSTGTTNEQGEYKLTYNSQNMGAMIGTHVATVANPPLDAPPTPGDDVTQGPIPEKYAGWSTEVEVQAGNNTIDLNVTAPAAK